MIRFVILSFTFLATVAPLSWAQWTGFRGPNGEGIYNGPKIVTEWGPKTNVAWMTEIPGEGWSSPVVDREVIYLTTGIADKNQGVSLEGLAIDAKTGKVIWRMPLFDATPQQLGRKHSKNTYASPTPVVEGERVYFHFGPIGTACVHTSGRILWITQNYSYAPVHGPGGSPILFEGKLIFSADGSDQQFVAALDAETGKQLWKTDRKSTAQKRFSFTTPLVIEDGQQEIVVSAASEFVAGYDATTGKEVWRANYPNGGYSLISRPVVAEGNVIIQTGYNTPFLFALKPDGSGDISKQIQWVAKKGAPNTPSPIASKGEIYSVSDSGFLTCYDAKTGETDWSERLAGRAYSSSPIIVNGMLYIISEEGIGQVIEANPNGFLQVAKSRMAERVFATPAPVNGSLYVRTEGKLYRFDAK